MAKKNMTCFFEGQSKAKKFFNNILFQRRFDTERRRKQIAEFFVRKEESLVVMPQIKEVQTKSWNVGMCFV